VAEETLLFNFMIDKKKIKDTKQDRADGYHISKTAKPPRPRMSDAVAIRHTRANLKLNKCPVVPKEIRNLKNDKTNNSSTLCNHSSKRSLNSINEMT